MKCYMCGSEVEDLEAHIYHHGFADGAEVRRGESEGPMTKWAISYLYRTNGKDIWNPGIMIVTQHPLIVFSRLLGDSLVEQASGRRGREYALLGFWEADDLIASHYDH